MAARCASCSYPLSVSDSVLCCECSSYFHIDCAQLVGFPYYELSSDPIRNTFHCQTCKLLPLPQCSNDFSDSDSDECTMPSRQPDCQLESNLAKEMNEVKGTVQDLSDLCKDMFREISELKSINLTLRCCVENLRQDGEQRDSIISDLKRRIEALEGIRTINAVKPIGTADFNVNIISNVKEENPERYLTLNLEQSRLKKSEDSEFESCDQEDSLPIRRIQNLIESENKIETSEAIMIDAKTTLKHSETSNTAIEIMHTDKRYYHENKIYERNEENMHYAGEEIISTSEGEDYSKKVTQQDVENWDWKGNEAIKLKEDDNSVEVKVEDSTADIEDPEAQDWEILQENVKYELTNEQHEEESSDNDKITETSAWEPGEKRVTWADDVEDNEEDENEESEDPKYTEKPTKLKGEETEETTEDVSEGEDRSSVKEEDASDRSKVEEYLEIAEGGVEIEDYIKAVYTGRVEGSRLEKETPARADSEAEEDAAPEGVREGGQSPMVQGEVQPSELSEGLEPPHPPQPQHSPDDLWDFLKESVTGEHPATVEEFVQKLIGTLEHVPEEYLKPVIEYNIKRANSPSVTDGEHLELKEEDQQLQGEGQAAEDSGAGEANPREPEVAQEGEDLSTLPGQEKSAFERDEIPPEDPTDFHNETSYPEERSVTPEEYSALEATS